MAGAPVNVPRIAVAGTVLAAIGAFWAFGDRYLTIREHEQFRLTIERDIQQLRTDMMSRAEFDRWSNEQDKIDHIRDGRLDALEHRK